MKNLIYLLLFALCISPAITCAQGVSINNTNTLPDTSAALDVSSTTKGVLVPRMTQAERNLIPLPAVGLMIYQTDNTPGFYNFTGSVWKQVGITMPQPHKAIFKTPGSFTFTTSVNITTATVFKVTVTGGGGGGGGAFFISGFGGGGGGGGATNIYWLNGLAPATDYTVITGSGGAGGFGDGLAGNPSSFSAVSANPGNGGLFGEPGFAGLGGTGGASDITADISMQGTKGLNGTQVGSFSAGGDGATSNWGAGGAGGNQSGSPEDATSYGAGGGGGGFFYNVGAAGQSGIVVVEWSE